ncbi:DUF1735 and LamG domain-containing protein [Niabella pedocola]|uniref:DUF1735 and LamG domain-containing protein n=1 Tax=Niabella pedocola TaxID=1752077 RepID=A0ABS8PL31_9BACT|nr:DUF1735 and LamG domain-containing protein [Niabella pedocola]MCD2421809.1 DUF1735 and LamG domain-containing protein [Niabella pedocola]
MKTHTKNICVAALLIIIGFTACKKTPGYSVITDAIYLSEAAQGGSTKLVIDENGATVTVTPRMAQPATRAIMAKVVVDAAALNAFNKKNGTNYLPVPAELVTLSENTVSIPAGAVSAPAVNVSIRPFTTQMEQSGDKYALSLSLTDVSGTGSLASLSNFVYEFEPVIVTAVPVVNRNNAIKMAMRQDYSLQAWSVEMRVNMDRLGTSIGQYNNQALFGAYPSEIYIRFGDAPIPGNVLQVKHQGTQINCNTVFSASKWYHLAFVSDGNQLKIFVNGELDATLALPGNLTNLSRDQFSMIGSGSYFVANCMLNEVRFWTKAISQDQIKNNMYAINPKTDGLEAYWKMNEGVGNVFADATGHGCTATAAGTVSWSEGVRMPAQ